jgi:glycosyltransferase involved in cell wall biosynthesis
MIICLWRRVRAAPPDVIFCPGNTYTVVVVALRLLLGRSCPPVVAKLSNSLARGDMHAPVALAYRAWLAIQGRLIEVFVAMTPSLRDEAVEAIRAYARKVAVIEDPALNAADIQQLAKSREERTRDEGSGRLFISAGRLVPQKRFDRLLRAFAEGSREGDHLIILGDGPLRASLTRLVRNLGLDTRVKMPGHTADPAGWLARADAFVLASDYEGVPAALVEALAAGLPVIATDSSAAIPELLGYGRYGHVVARGDAVALARAIGQLDSSTFDALGARRCAARFQVERAGPAYLGLLATTYAQRCAASGREIIASAPSPVGMDACGS